VAFGKELEPVPTGDIAAHLPRAALLFEAVPARRERDSNRWLFCLVLAALLHVCATLFWARSYFRAPLSASASPPVSESAPVEVGVAEDEPRRPPGPLPGGGSIVPNERAQVSAPEQRVAPVKPALRVQRAQELNQRALPKVELGNESAPPFPSDLLASDDSADTVVVRPARLQHLEDKPQPEAATAPEAALQTESQSHSHGAGAGVNGGPGGLGQGQGSGVIDKHFAFGGPTGAFRAEVCFIERTVQRLTDITECTPVTTFFTSVLDVPPRRFDSGFPGLGPRTEWFAIKYRGKFRVRKDDSYTFRLLSDDGARLEIDGRQILDNDGQHMPRSVSCNVRLAAGEHDFYVFYYQGPAAFLALQLFVTPFGHEEQLFTPEF
jgi:hypothetical protein